MLLGQSTPNDVQAVLDVSALLEISEYRVFQLAFERWHGQPPNDPALERIFARYMLNDEVPVWVRDYSYDVLGRTEEASPDQGPCGPAAPAPVASGWLGELGVTLSLSVRILYYSRAGTAALGDPKSRTGALLA